jgi:hypothetical protein
MRNEKGAVKNAPRPRDNQNFAGGFYLRAAALT